MMEREQKWNRKKERETEKRQALRQMDGWEPHPWPASSLSAPSTDKQLRRKSSIISSGHVRQGHRLCFAEEVSEAALSVWWRCCRWVGWIVRCWKFNLKLHDHFLSSNFCHLFKVWVGFLCEWITALDWQLCFHSLRLSTVLPLYYFLFNSTLCYSDANDRLHLKTSEPPDGPEKLK